MPERNGYSPFDLAMQLRHLAQAEGHIAQGKRHIAEQEERVTYLTDRGHDTKEARKLLENFYLSQAQHLQHRDRIREELNMVPKL